MGKGKKNRGSPFLFFSFLFFHDFDFYHGGGAILAFFSLPLPLLLGAFYHNVTSLLIDEMGLGGVGGVGLLV